MTVVVDVSAKRLRFGGPVASRPHRRRCLIWSFDRTVIRDHGS